MVAHTPMVFPVPPRRAFGTSMAIELTLVPLNVSTPVKPPSSDAEVGRAGEQLLLELHEARQVEEERIVARTGEGLAAAD